MGGEGRKGKQGQGLTQLGFPTQIGAGTARTEFPSVQLALFPKDSILLLGLFSEDFVPLNGWGEKLKLPFFFSFYFSLFFFKCNF